MLKNIMLVMFSLILVGCSSTKPISVNTVPIDRPKLNLTLPDAVELNDFEFVVLTDKNIEEVLNEIKDRNGKVVLFAVTPNGYEAISINNLKVQIYIKQLLDQLQSYKEYYEK